MKYLLVCAQQEQRLIPIRFQVSVRKTIKETNCIVSCPCFSVMVKDDRWQSIFTRAEQPHERISFGISFRLLQYLYPCFIYHVNFCSFFDTLIIPQRALKKKQKCQYFQSSKNEFLNSTAQWGDGIHSRTVDIYSFIQSCYGYDSF